MSEHKLKHGKNAKTSLLVEMKISSRFIHILEFTYATKFELLMIIMGLFLSFALGLIEPVTFYVFGETVDLFLQSNKDFQNDVYYKSIIFAILSFAAFIFGFLQMFTLQFTALSQTDRIITLYYKSVLRQDPAWFDQQNSSVLITNLTQKIEMIRKALGTKLGLLFRSVVTFFAGFTITFLKSWKLALIGLVTIALDSIAFIMLAYALKRFAINELKDFDEASKILGDALSSLRNVFGNGSQDKEHERYEVELGKLKKIAIRRSTIIGIVIGVLGFLTFASASVIYWYGVKLVLQNEVTPGIVVTAFLNMVAAVVALGTIALEWDVLASAKEAGVVIFSTIKRQTELKSFPDGIHIEEMRGRLEFKDVSFSYKSRENHQVLESMAFGIDYGKFVAFLGSSGSGKSTIVKLVERFYDPTSGAVCVDNYDLRQLDQKTYRAHISLVEQEPRIFTGTVRENICLGKLNATEQEIVNAAKLSNAHEFITNFRKGYDKQIQGSGSNISDGQKQRIAIARALIRNPKILLLDEATSNLDIQSSKIIMKSITKLRGQCTIIMITSKATRAQYADKIFVLDKGCIKQCGTHEQLNNSNGIYKDMYSKQVAEDLIQQQLDETDEIMSQLTDKDEDDSEEEKDGDSEDEDNDKKKTCSCLSTKKLKKLARFDRPKWSHSLTGALTILFSILINPAYVLLYSQIFNFSSKVIPNFPEALQRTILIVALMIVLAIVYLLVKLLQGYIFGAIGQKLFQKLKGDIFKILLNQNVNFYNMPRNQVGTLVSSLVTDPSDIENISGIKLASQLEKILSVLPGFIIGFIDCWPLALMLLCTVPVLLSLTYIQYHFVDIRTTAARKRVNAMNVACESFKGNQTVMAYGLQNYFIDKFNENYGLNKKYPRQNVIVTSFISALSFAISAACCATAFPLGAYLISLQLFAVFSVLRGFTAITFSLTVFTGLITFVPDFRKATVGVMALIHIINKASKTTPVTGNEEPKNQIPENLTITFKNTSSKTDGKPVCHSFLPGRSYIITGPSGCGKSTLFEKILGFRRCKTKEEYTAIYLGDIQISNLSADWIKENIGYISQQPVLPNVSIYDLLTFGLKDNSTDMETVIKITKQVNLHEFIQTLPQGYDSFIGEEGCQLSTTQKQQICIAQQLLRKPFLLLIDGGLSELDQTTEKCVFQALDELKKSNCCILMVNCPNGIKYADEIISVTKNGLKKIKTGSN